MDGFGYLRRQRAPGRPVWSRIRRLWRGSKTQQLERRREMKRNREIMKMRQLVTFHCLSVFVQQVHCGRMTTQEEVSNECHRRNPRLAVDRRPCQKILGNGIAGKLLMLNEGALSRMSNIIERHPRNSQCTIFHVYINSTSHYQSTLLLFSDIPRW